MRHVLFVDNDPDFLKTRSEFLEKKGYSVMKAFNIETARTILREQWFPVVILDVRLENDDDEKDSSGIVLAKSDECRSLTRIILTNFDVSYIPELLLIASNNRSQIMIDVLSKQEGPERLLQALENAFTRYVHINWDLVIDWTTCDPFSLVRSIEPNLERESLLNRVEEFEDLFRRLFYEKEHIRIQRLRWQRNGRIALVVLAFKEGTKPESYVVVCGQNPVVNEEARKFSELAPKAPSETGTKLSQTEETTHFAVNAYSFVNVDLEKIQSLKELYNFAPLKVFRDALIGLFQKTLKEWHQERLKSIDIPLELLYRQRFQLSEAFTSNAYFEDRVRAIEKQALEHRLRIERMDGKVSFTFGEKIFSYRDPLLLISQTPEVRTTLIIDVPGDLTGENILADESGRTWLTDFATAGYAPLPWNYVSLEAVIRFDWINTNNFVRRQELEDCFTNRDFAKPDIRSLEPEVKKTAQALLALRKLAERVMLQDVTTYHLGIFYQAWSRLLNFNPAFPLPTAEFMRIIHIYLSMAMQTSKIVGDSSVKPVLITNQVSEIIILDRKLRKIMVGSQEIKLSGQCFAVFEYLFDRPGDVCTKEDLVNKALQGKYNQGYLHTLVGRIRKQIEEDPEQPRYLITEPYDGYRLIIDPK